MINPTVTTHISLRPWSLTDAPRVAELMNSPVVLRYLTCRLPNPYTLADAEAFLTKVVEQVQPQRAILFDCKVVGCVGVRPDFETQDCMLGYWPGASWHGRGIATQAVEQFLELLPELVPGTKTVTAYVYEPNIASIRVLQKCGFSHQGTQPAPPQAGDGNNYPGLCFRTAL